MRSSVHCTALLAIATWAAAGPAAVAQDLRLNSTTIEGPILFRDELGQTIPPPYDVTIMDKLLKVETLDHQTGLPRGSPPRVDIKPFDHEIIRFNYRVKLDRASLWLRFDFNYDGYEARDRIEIYEHRGTIPDRQLVIQRSYPDRNARVRAVIQALAEPNLLETDIDRTLRLIEGLIDDPISEGSESDADIVERYEDYKRAVALMQQVMRQGKPLSPEISVRISTLHERLGFTIQPVQQQFDILSDFAYWFARSPTPDQQIQSTLTHGGLARMFFETAYALAYDANELTPIAATPLIQTLQERYAFECPTKAEIDSDKATWTDACFFALHDAGSFDRNFAPSVYGTVMGDFHYHLETASRPRSTWATECGYRQKIADERDDMAFYWELYAMLAEEIASRHRRMELELAPNRNFNSMTYIAQTLDRARDINALNSGEGRMLTRTCAAEPVLLPAGGEL